MAVAFAASLAPSPALAGGCIGDCDDDGATGTADIVLGVAAALAGEAGVCAALIDEGDEVATVDGLVRGVLDLLEGCGPAPEVFIGVYDAEIVYQSPTPTTFEGLATIRAFQGTTGVSIGASLYDSLSFIAHLVLPVEAASSGFGICGPASDESGGIVLGTIDADDCSVSPEGRISFGSTYRTAGPQPQNDYFRLRGELATEGGINGSYQIGYFPSAFVGSWRTEKLSDSPLAR